MCVEQRLAPHATARRDRQSGYALLLMIFFVATLLLFATLATPNVITEVRRQREEEMIWRGNQYVRAIRLFYQKNGRYPQNLEELTKPNAANIHILRKAYRDPINIEDGSWRLIYVSPSGQLIGSVHYRTLQEMAVATALGGQSGGNTSAIAAQLFGQPTGTSAPAQGLQTPANQGSSDSVQPTSLDSLQAVDSPVFGGSVIGVAGKIKKSSIRVYQGSSTYFEWEFIWNPLLNGNVPPMGVIPGAPGVPLPSPSNPVPRGVPPTATSAPGETGSQ